ncbi:MAG TPA: mechanosensitive ion channel family protein [Candidatus Saccharimonadales bacterium]|nr:mechanosensitive ion channel family protein [Candidatus Saccharimonadales bacterium]
MDTVHHAVTFINDHRSVQIGITLLVAVLLQMLSRLPIDRFVRRVVVQSHRYHSAEEEKKREDTLISVFHTAFAVVIWTITLITILFEMRVNVAGLLTGAGVLGVVVSLGAKNAISDFLAGIFIIGENQYRVGDIVTLATSTSTVSGVVEDITVRITKLRDLDGYLHIVPNGSIGVVTNMTFQFANVNVDIPVAYEADVDKVVKIINQVGVSMVDDKEIGGDVVEPIQFLRVDNFEDSSMKVKALGKVRAGTQWDVAGDFRKRLIAAFDKHHVNIPYQQIVVHKSEKKR